jgi:predicted O-methyltransferase YrrM
MLFRRFLDKAVKVLKLLEKIGEKRFIPSIGPVKGKIVEKVIENYRPKRILEIGTLFGYSAILMARLLPDDGKVVTIEINERSANISKKNIEGAGLSDKIEVLIGDALEVIPKLDGRFDLMFIDATKEEYLDYLVLAEKNLEKGSVVIADNVGIFEKHMLDYLDYVRNSGRYKSETIRVPLEFREYIEDAMEISIKI